MYFRFMSALVLVVLVSMAGVAIEKRNLELRREISRQQYHTEILMDRHTALRLRTQELSSPDRMLEVLRENELNPAPGRPGAPTGGPRRYSSRRRLPLMHWERPAPRADVGGRQP